ncbi:TPR-like protein [Mycena olivaceomarginata]|nr:TPR-like protein [Mycena olivaceomarginata]
MFKPGDKLNPYDPASLDLGDEGVLKRISAGTSPMTPQIASIVNDPAKMEMFLQMMRDDAAERERTGETQMEQVLREKREWAEADARSAELKATGNDAFKRGEYKTAYVLYTACMHLSGHEPLYPLNRAAVALKLKLYDTAAEDASGAIAAGNFNSAKAYFRRGQARYFLGDWAKAEEDYAEALKLQPGDRSVVDQVAELKRLRGLPTEDQAAWIAAQAPLTQVDVFGAGEVRRRVEEVLGTSLDAA